MRFSPSTPLKLASVICARSMVRPFEKVPTTRPLSLTETDCIAGRKAVLLERVDLHVAVRVGELGEAGRAMLNGDGAERDAIDGQGGKYRHGRHAGIIWPLGAKV